jgi:Protein of unknown function (DUF3829)
MYRFVLALALLFTACKKDNSTTGEPAREAMGLYAKGFNALIADPKGMITEYFEKLPDGPQPDSKPRLFAKQNFATSKISEARDAFVAAKKSAPASLAGLAAPADQALVAIDKVAVAFTAAHKYYDAENYKDDSFAKGKELHGQMVEASKQFQVALHQLEDGLSVIEDQQATDELKKYAGDRGYSYWFRAYNIEAKKFLTAVERADAPEPRAALATAFTPMQKADEELAKFVEAKGTKLNASFKAYVGAAGRYNASAVKLLRLVKDAKPDEAAIGREFDALVSGYNSLVSMANSLYQLEGADALK